MTATRLLPDIIDRARAVPIDQVAAPLQLRREGRELVGPCPACGGRDRFQINVRNGKWLCRAGGNDAIGLVMHTHGLDFLGAVELLTGDSLPAQVPRQQAPMVAAPAPDDDGMARADDIWRQSVPIAGTAGANWLATRGILLDEVPDDGGLRFHPACPYGSGRKAACILARFTDVLTGAPRGLHRRAVTAGVTPKTMTLGPMGGAVVRLWPDEDITHGLIIGEGVETVLAAATHMQHRGTLLRPAWACCVANNMETFPVLPGVEALTILADNDVSGRGQQAAARCAERWADAGAEVTILTPRDLGDMNDVIKRVAT